MDENNTKFIAVPQILSKLANSEVIKETLNHTAAV